MLYMVIVTFLGPFLSFILYTAFNVVQSQCFLHIIILLILLTPELPHFMLNKVNATFLGPFLSLHYVCKLIMWFNFVSLLFWIV